MSEIRYFRVKSSEMKGALYYAAYDSDAAFRKAASDTNSQKNLAVTEVRQEIIPPAAIVHRAGLSHADAREVTRLFPGEFSEGGRMLIP